MKPKSYTTYDDIKNGADIKFFMSNSPNYKKGITDECVPLSLSKDKRAFLYDKMKN